MQWRLDRPGEETADRKQVLRTLRAWSAWKKKRKIEERAN
jgi:hypothetical protein